MAGSSKQTRDKTRERTLALYQQGLGCRQIAEELDENPVSTYRRLSRMGLVRSREEAYDILNEVGSPAHLPFSGKPQASRLRASAIGAATRWFLERGYVPSLPVEPSRYDLVVESDDGLKKVQVKTSAFKGKGGRWQVHVHRTAYDASVEARGSAGKRRSLSYLSTDVDYFFVVTPDSVYLLPIAVVGEAHNITLGRKYDSFKI